MLCGLGLELFGGGYVRQVGHVDIHGIVPADLVSHLPDGFQERLALDVAYGAAHLDDHCLSFGDLRYLADAPLDLVGHVRYDLDRASQVIASSLAGDYR